MSVTHLYSQQSGAVYLGRGSVNVEGPLAYSSKAQIGSYWSLSLSSPTTKFHNVGETVILSQGGVRTVPINTVVISPGIGTTPDIQYSVTQTGTILDGETTVTNVPVTALLPGAAGNVPAGEQSVNFPATQQDFPKQALPTPRHLLRALIQKPISNLELGSKMLWHPLD